MICKKALHTWSRKSFELARETNKPLLVTSFAGSALCEKTKLNFASDALKSDLDSFVPIHLNSRLQRNVDTALMQFLKLRSGTGGWPLTVALSPQSGRPFMACSYLDQENMSKFLKTTISSWTENAPGCELVGTEATETLVKQGLGAPVNGNEPDLSVLKEDAMLQYKFMADQTPRFVMGNALAHMEQEFRTSVMKEISRSGLVDHIHGGVFSYSLSKDWHLPSFYKRLKDQATLLNAVNAYYRNSAHLSESGDTDVTSLGLSLIQSCSSLLTNRPAVIAEPYVWTHKDFDKALRSLGLIDRDIAQEYWGINLEGNINESYTKLNNILGDLVSQNVLSKYREPSQVAKTFGVSEEKVLEVIAVSKKLLSEGRSPPLAVREVDPPLNSLGLALSALSECPLPEAEKVTEAFATKLALKPVDGDVCEDYANVVSGFLSYFNKTGGKEWLELALKWQEAQDSIFDDSCGYFYGKPDDLLYLRPKFWEDSSEPNYQAVSAHNLKQLANHVPEYAAKSAAIISNGLKLAKSSPLAYTSYF